MTNENNNIDTSILDKIEINLPSIDDMLALRSAYSDEITQYCGEKDEFRFNIHTDLATLTGKDRLNRYFYLRDVDKADENNILYYYDGSITSDDFYTTDSNTRKKIKNPNRYSRIFLIRPVLSFEKCPEIFDLLPFERKDKNGNDLKYSKINLGCYPRYAYPNSPCQVDLYSSPDLIQTEEAYTFDSINVFGKNSYKKTFKPIVHWIYKYKNQKYINYRVNQCKFLGDALDRVLGLLSENITLSNNEKYYSRDNLLLEVTQIPWTVDIKRKVLIAQEGLISGIQFEKFDEDKKIQTPVDYESSNIKWFLNTFMKYEMLRDEELLKKIAIKTNNSPANEISKLLNEIKQYRKYYLGDIDIESKVKALLNDYNNELDKLSKKIDNETNNLTVEITNPKLLYQRLKINLEEILFELKTHGEKVKSYHNMIDILSECQKEEIDISKDELCNIINVIKKTIIEFITYEDIKEKLANDLNEIINKTIDRNKGYIEEFKYNDQTNTKSIDELKLEFRKELHPFLEELFEIVKKQDIVNDIWNDIKVMIKNEFTESKNKLVSNYSNILNSIVLEIRDKGNNKDNDNLDTLLNNITFDLNEDISLIMKKFELVIIKAYKIQLDIEERQMKNTEIDDLKIKFDVSTVFEEKSNTK